MLTIAEEVALLEAASNGGRAEVDALVRYLTPYIQKRVAHELLRRGHGQRRIRWDVEDGVHEVWAHLLDSDWRILRRWDPKREVPLKSFVAMVTTHHLIDVQRSGRKTPFLEEPAPVGDLERDSPLVEDIEQRTEQKSFLSKLLNRLRERLSPAAWEIFGVMYLEDMEVAEAASRTGMTVSSVYSHRKRISKIAHQVAAQIAQDGE